MYTRRNEYIYVPYHRPGGTARLRWWWNLGDNDPVGLFWYRSELLCKALANMFMRVIMLVQVQIFIFIPVYIFVGAWPPYLQAVPIHKDSARRSKVEMLDQAALRPKQQWYAVAYACCLLVLRCHARTFDHYNWMAIVIYFSFTLPHASFE